MAEQTTIPNWYTVSVDSAAVAKASEAFESSWAVESMCPQYSYRKVARLRCEAPHAFDRAMDCAIRAYMEHVNGTE